MKLHLTATFVFLGSALATITTTTGYLQNKTQDYLTDQAFLSSLSDSSPEPATAYGTGTKDGDDERDTSRGLVNFQQYETRLPHTATVALETTDDNGPPTKTYERVVVEGSSISISCPHSITIVPETLFATSQQRENVPNKRKQFAFLQQQTATHPNSVVPTAPPAAEQVKWFRNHVPLLNSNHFQRPKSLRPDPDEALAFADLTVATTTSPIPALTAVAAAEEEEKEASQTIASSNIRELNRTTELSQNTRLANNVPWQAQGLLTILSSFRHSGDSLTSENVNELTADSRKLTNILVGSSKLQSEAQLYINKFGELVINKVSKYFAGKYTCLVGGKQSEVLLDVLVDSGSNSSSSSSGRLPANKAQVIQTQQLTHIEAPIVVLSGQGEGKTDVKVTRGAGSAKLAAPNGRGEFGNSEFSMDFDYQRAGSGSIEEEEGEKSSETTTSRMALFSLLDQQANAERYDVREGTRGEKDNSLVDSNSSVEVNLIKTFKGDVRSKTGSEQLFAGKNVLKNSDEKTISVDIDREKKDITFTESSMPKATTTTMTTNSKINVSKLRHFQQRQPVHTVKSEAIQLNDLKLIPGFLYTKQQLYCPVRGGVRIGQSGLHRDHIYPLVHALCPSHLKFSSADDEAELKCYHLAERLISEIVVSSQELSENCSTSIMDLTWFKDGVQLEFDTNGRGTDTNLNVKLINFFDQSSVSASSIDSVSLSSKRGEVVDFNIETRPTQTTTTPTITTNTITATTSSSNSKWICPPKGRALEIDGVRKDSAGRYTCALKLSISKLDKIIRSLRQLNQPRRPIKWAHTAHDNDILCCDEHHQRRLFTGTHSQQQQLTEQSSLDFQAQIETTKTIRSNSSESTVELLADESSVVQKLIVANGDSLAKRIAILESILKGTIASEQSLNYIEQVLSSLQNPLTTIQTFSLVVAERTANSCELWSTILEASNAYTRRKLADFKRLKRALSNRDGVSPPSSDLKNVHAFTDRSTSPIPMESARDSSTIQEALNVIEPIKRLNANIDGELELNNYPQNEEYTMKVANESQYNRQQQHGNHRSNQVGTIDESIDRDEGPLNGSHSMPDNNDSQTVVTADQLGYNLLLNNADELESDIEASVDGQTKNRIVVPTMPFNYANEGNLRPSSRSSSHYTRTSGDLNMNRVLARRKRSSMIKGNDHDNLDSETKDLILERGSHTINIVPAATTTTNNFEARENGFSRSDRHPMVIDDLQDETSSPYVIDDNMNGKRGDEISQSALAKVAARVLTNFDKTKVANEEAKSDAETLAQLNGVSWTIGVNERDKRQNPPQGDKLQPLNTRYYRSVSSQSSNKLNSSITQLSIRDQFFEDTHPTTSPGKDTHQLPSTNQSSLSNSKSLDGQTPSNVQSYANYQLGDVSSVAINDGSVQMSTGTMGPILKDDNSFDESLMWTTGQYLYMHMRALAASSIFGVEVDVEWSNERSNGTNSDPDIMSNKESKISSDSQDIYSHYARVRDTTPFATIDVISGQILHLQCTAHALGRLPEVKWYKRVDTIPSRLKGLAPMIRKIGYDLYWPLTELDIYNENENPKSLQLSQYNDKIELETVKTSNSLPASNFNLYACIVDADIRHNYATLGVHFREAPNKIPFEISKRLHARSVLTKSEPSIRRSMPYNSGSTTGSNNYANFDLFRENQLQFPLKSYWVPIQNGSGHSEDIAIEGFPLTPAMLSVIIVFVFSSLLALIYLTLLSYRALTHLQIDDLDNELVESANQRVTDIEAAQNVVNGKPPNTMNQNVSLNTAHSTCLCQFETANLSHGSPSLNILTEVRSPCGGNSFFTEFDDIKKSDLNIRMGQTFYEAHIHNIEPHYACHSVTEPLISQLPSEDKNDYSYSQYDHKSCQQFVSGCCQSSLLPMISCPPDDRLRVNMVENPLNAAIQDQYFVDQSEETSS